MAGPLAAFAEAYSAELRVRGYTPLTVVNELRQVGRLSRWLGARGLGASELSGDRVEQFLVWQRAGGRHRCQWSRPGLVCLLEVLRGLGVLAAEEPVSAGSPPIRCWRPLSVICSRGGGGLRAPLVAI
jgi:integrase/recombinase XerD